MVADTVLADRLQQRECTHQVRLEEWVRVVQRVVVVRLRGVVDDTIGGCHQLFHNTGIGNITVNEMHAIVG